MRVTAPANCSGDEFRCDNGQCINATLRCDRKYHCDDGTDEFHCGKFQIKGKLNKTLLIKVLLFSIIEEVLEDMQ